MKTKLLPMLAMLALVIGSGAVLTPPATAAKKFTACVKKSTGEMRILLGKSKKCSKGWTKRTWTKAGPKGMNGPTGPPNSFGKVVDVNSAVIGDYLGLFPGDFGALTVLFVSIDGGIYAYDSSGFLTPTIKTELYFDNASCSGEPFLYTISVAEKDVTLMDPALRLVYRVSQPALGPAAAYRVQGTSDSVSGLPTWTRSGTGSCDSASAVTGYRIPLTPIPAPPDHPGPLRIR